MLLQLAKISETELFTAWFKYWVLWTGPRLARGYVVALPTTTHKGAIWLFGSSKFEFSAFLSVHWMNFLENLNHFFTSGQTDPDYWVVYSIGCSQLLSIDARERKSERSLCRGGVSFCACVQFSRDSIRAFNDRIKIRENWGLWTIYVLHCLVIHVFHGEYMRDHIIELWRKIWRYDWSSQLIRNFSSCEI